MRVVIDEDLAMALEECVTCGVAFAIPAALRRDLKETGRTYYCPSGHGQSYKGGDVRRLQQQLAAERAARERAEQDLRETGRLFENAQRAAEDELRRRLAAEKALAKVGRPEARAAAAPGRPGRRRRAGTVVCPECGGAFRRLALHMTLKHPEPIGESAPSEQLA